jgi:hypothetical protein
VAAKLLKGLWDDIRPNLVWTVLVLIFGGGVITAIVAWLRTVSKEPITVETAAVIFGVCFIGLALLFIAVRLRKGQPIVSTQMIIYIPILVGLAMLVWAYFIGSAVLRTNEDVRHLRAQMVRYVLPRKLSPEQIASIGDYLSHQERNQVVMEVINRDEEASSYRADIQQALEKGGWVVSDFKYADDVQEGLRISMFGPMVSSPTPASPFDRLNPKPTPVQILQEAFKRSGVEIQGTGGGSGVGVTTTTITISIGRRRRDAYAIMPSNYLEGLRPRQRPITDDDFDNR